MQCTCSYAIVVYVTLRTNIWIHNLYLYIISFYLHPPCPPSLPTLPTYIPAHPPCPPSLPTLPTYIPFYLIPLSLSLPTYMYLPSYLSTPSLPPSHPLSHPSLTPLPPSLPPASVFSHRLTHTAKRRLPSLW